MSGRFSMLSGFIAISFSSSSMSLASRFTVVATAGLCLFQRNSPLSSALYLFTRSGMWSSWYPTAFSLTLIAPSYTPFVRKFWIVFALNAGTSLSGSTHESSYWLIMSFPYVPCSGLVPALPIAGVAPSAACIPWSSLSM